MIYAAKKCNNFFIAKNSDQFSKICFLYSNFCIFAKYYSVKSTNHKMISTETLDETDIKILKELQRDSHQTVKELAARINLSPSPTFERQKRLEREGYIERYMAVVNPEKVGNGMMVLCNIRLKQHNQKNNRDFLDAVQTIDEITECYNTSGDYDFQIKVYVRDMNDYQKFILEKLGNIDCIGYLHSVFVIGVIKSTRAVPIKG